MCGIAMVRLLKPLDYYQEKYGTWQYGLQKMYLLMEKQHKRGQEGAGLATVKLDVPPGEEYIWRERFEGKNAIQEIFAGINNTMKLAGHEVLHSVEKAKADLPFAAELYLWMEFLNSLRNSIKSISCNFLLKDIFLGTSVNLLS